MLKINNLHKSFTDKLDVLNGINIEIKEGSIFGLVGINGAGKSTLLRCISGVYMPNGGEVLFNNENTYTKPEIRKDIFYVSDDCYYPSNATINTMRVIYESFYSIDENRFNKYLKVFGLNETSPISNFSKGMKRQVSLLFALSIKPKLLLLDECFDGLDPLVRLTFKKALVELIEDDDITVIISSHNLKELEDICDSFGILENGQINTYGDLLESKENIAKFQLAYKENKLDFKSMFNCLSIKQEGRIITLVVKGDIEEVRKTLKKSKPIIMEELPVNFEELFIYEVESRGLLNE